MIEVAYGLLGAAVSAAYAVVGWAARRAKKQIP